MTAYGDITRTFTAAERLARIDRATDPIARLLEAGELAQAAIDAEFFARGRDAMTPLHAQMLRMLLECGGHAAALGDCQLTSKVPEGYAYYAVLPELYARAAQRAGPKQRRRVVIGIRTIGTSLGAVVANAVDADVFLTVRPIGDPFHRTLAIDDDIRALLADRDAEYFVVDEGPGLSGSSFIAVAEAIASDRIVFLPSHDNGPGPQAAERTRQRWASTPKLYEPFAFDPRWIEPIIGRIDRPPIDLGAGAWRSVARREAPSWVTHERRKYLIESGGRRWLAKFAGLGLYGQEKLEKARRLAARGLMPPVAGLAHGFLVTEWRDAEPVTDRDQLLDAVARYLLVLAAERAPSWRSGLSPHQLRDRAGLNSSIEFEVQPIDSDGRMHAWEWIATASGDVLKCDALDHSSSHDGIGVQDLAWDFAGAVVEHDLTGDEAERLRRALGNARRWSDAQLDFYRAAYCRLQSAIFRQAADELRGWAPDEAERLSAHAARYGGRASARPPG